MLQKLLLPAAAGCPRRRLAQFGCRRRREEIHRHQHRHVNGKMMSADQILNGFGCMGGNNSPEVKWDNPPVNTKSFAVTLSDPEAPRAAAGGIGSRWTFRPPYTNCRKAREKAPAI